jgi:hypothetical protein
MNIVQLTTEQLELIDQLKSIASTIYANPELRGDESAIAGVKAAIDKGYAAKLPPAALTELQMIASAYDTEMAMPEHLRNFKRGH